MARQHKPNSASDTNQINFFTDQEKKPEEPDNKIGNSDVKNTQNSQIHSIFDEETDPQRISDHELSDTEIIESEILPEQTIEPMILPSDENKSIDQDLESDTGEKEKISEKISRVPNKLRRESILIHILVLVAETISKTIRNSFFASIFTAYDKTSELFKASFLYRFFTEKPASFFRSFKKTVRRTFTYSVIPKKTGNFMSSLLLVKTRIYGLILFSFGTSALLVHFFINLYFFISSYNIYTPFVACGTMIGSLFLIFSKKTLSQDLSNSRIFSAVGFRLLGITKNSLNQMDCIELSGSGAIVLGLLLGFLTVFFPSHSILLFILSIICIFIVIKSPESGLISLFLIAPFASLSVLACAIGVIMLSYIFKVLCGKRTLMLEFPDLFVGLFIVVIIFGGIISFGENSNVLLYVLFIGIYFVAASILRNDIWFKRSVNSIILIGSVVSVYAIIARFLGEPLGFNLDITLETDVGDASASVISSFSVLSYFVLTLGMFLLSAFLICRPKVQRFVLLIVNIAAVIFLFFTLPSGAWFAAVLAYIIILILWKNRLALYMIIISLFLPFLPLLKIYSVENFFTNLVSYSDRFNLWNTVFRMSADFGIGGIGLGNDTFTSVYSAYFIGNTENLTHAGSLLMQILISLGIMGLLIFAIIIFFTLQSSLSYGRSCSDKSGSNRILCYSGMCGIIASFIWGINEFIWYNPHVMLLFWLIMAVTVSARRSALDLETSNKESNLYGDTYLE